VILALRQSIIRKIKLDLSLSTADRANWNVLAEAEVLEHPALSGGEPPLRLIAWRVSE
jgi:hypothetical protein